MAHARKGNKMGASSDSWGNGSGGRSDPAMEGIPRPMKWLHRLDSVMVRLDWIPRWLLTLGAASVLFFALDRTPPYGIVSVDPAVARPGQTVTLRWSGLKDTTRRCKMHVSRSLFDMRGDRVDYPMSYFSADVLDHIETLTPGRRSLTIYVPETVAPGPVELVNTLNYECNRVHAIWPITVTTVLPFTVLPP